MQSKQLSLTLCVYSLFIMIIESLMLKTTRFFSILLIFSLPGFAVTIDHQAMLAAHNQARAKVNTSPALPPLLYSKQLAKSAQKWANTLKKEGCQIRHSHTSGLGENLFQSIRLSSAPIGVTKLSSESTVVTAWDDEKQDFDYIKNTCAAPPKMCGHYTQIVWRNTTHVGCAMMQCDVDKQASKHKMYEKHEVWVCQYTPPGNMIFNGVKQKPY